MQRQRGGYVAKLVRFAGRSSLRALSRECRLRDVLAGTTCSPISMEDFELYLAYREYSLENLQFVVWFHDYQLRFSRLPDAVRMSCPDPLSPNFKTSTSPTTATSSTTTPLPSLAPLSTATSSATTSALLEKRTPASRTRLVNLYLRDLSETLSTGSSSSPRTESHPPTPNTAAPLLPLSPTPSASGSGSGSKPTSGKSLFGYGRSGGGGGSAPASPLPPLNVASPADQPYRDEMLRIVATFIKPGKSKKELSLDESMREELLQNLAWTTHPNVFLRVYNQVYHQLEMSLHNFIVVSSTNINQPKQLYWYTYGTITLCIAFIVAMTTLCLIPAYIITSTNPNVLRPMPWRRGFRLMSVPFSAIGSMQVYSAYRGFCSEVFGRGSTQLKAWELADPAEVGVKWRRRRRKKRGGEEAGSKEGRDVEDLGEDWVGGGSGGRERTVRKQSSSKSKLVSDTAIIAPFADMPMDDGGVSDGSFKAGTVSSKSSKSSGGQQPVEGGYPPASPFEVAFVRPKRPGQGQSLVRPPVFGPEKVVLDERIRKYHQKILNDMAIFGSIWTVIWTVVVMCLPGRRPSG